MAAATGSPVAGLEPKGLWTFFEKLSSIPRPSKHEEKVLEWLISFAQERGLEHRQDGVGNLVICRPGSGGGEAAPPVVVQGHIDMVTEANSDVQHDFLTDPIRLRRNGDWLTAEGTTLGADNGIGVAAALALLDCPPDTKLPPLECLFTLDEETGLTGAFGLDPSLLTGRTMLNLDTEDWLEIFIGCAGGGDTIITLPVQSEAAADGAQPLRLSISGLLGGHSGLNIAEGRGNAVKLAAETLDAIVAAAPGARLARLAGGNKRNAIAREAEALILVPPADCDTAQRIAAAKADEFREQYGLKERALSLTLTPAEQQQQQRQAVLTAEAAGRLLSLLLLLPHGVAKMSHAVEGLVETSNNLAAVNPTQGSHGRSYTIVTSSRSSIAPALAAQRGIIARAAAVLGGSVEQDTAYPGWAPNPRSPVVQLTREVMQSVCGAAPKVGAIHAGLECGLLGAKVPGLDMVSYGPTIRGAHSPDERVQISTVEPFWRVTLALLARLADARA